MEKKFKNETELLDFANEINNRYIRDIFTKEQISKLKNGNKGKLGQAIEKYYFGKELNSFQGPDFDYLGIELKVTPLKRLKNNKLSPKERIKLTQLDIEDLIQNASIKNSNIWPKIENILIMWYLNNDNFEENRFVKSELLKIENSEFFKDIENDWSILRGKAISGKAHEFSESLTKYLGLARNGSGKDEKKISQPNGEQGYYKRAYSLKQQMLRKLVGSYEFKFNESVIDLLKNDLLGKQIYEIATEPINPEHKSAHVKAISNYYGVKTFSKLSEKFLNEYGKVVNFKTISVARNNNDSLSIKEEVKINIQILNEINNKWFDSEFSFAMENPFIFIICEYNKDNSKIKIIDIKEHIFTEEQVSHVINAYNEFMNRYWNGRLSDGKKSTVNFLKREDNKFVHFRPWALKATKTFTSPAGETLTRPGLWINSNEMEDILGIKE